MSVVDELKCEVCRASAIGVAASVFGPISHAYCYACLEANREVWSTIVGGLMGLRRGDAAEWTQPYIEATCKFYGKTEDELWAAIDEATAEYEKAMDEVEP